MNTKSISGRIIFEEYNDYDVSEFRVFSVANHMYSNIDFIECFKDKWKNWFWFDILRYSDIKIETLFKKYKKYMMRTDIKKEVEMIYANSKDPTLYKIRLKCYDDFTLRMKDYLNEYQKYCK